MRLIYLKNVYKMSLFFNLVKYINRIECYLKYSFMIFTKDMIKKFQEIVLELRKKITKIPVLHFLRINRLKSI